MLPERPVSEDCGETDYRYRHKSPMTKRYARPRSIYSESRVIPLPDQVLWYTAINSRDSLLENIGGWVH